MHSHGELEELKSVNSTKLKDMFDQIDYYLIRLLLLALLLISGSKLVQREFHGGDANERSVPGIARLQGSHDVTSVNPGLVSDLGKVLVAEGCSEKALGVEERSRSARRPRLRKTARTRRVIVSRSQD